MAIDIHELDTMQTDYKSAVEAWISAIKHEEALASGDHSVAEVDKWENASFEEEKLRDAAKDAKKKYEEAIRAQIYGFDAK